MTQSIHARKQEHIQIARHSKDADRRKFYFDAIKLTHRALPEIDYEKVSTSTTFLQHKLSFPLLISSMTGGTGSDLAYINRNLATAANTVGIAFATGSMRILLEDPSSLPAFDLRDSVPHVPFCGNMGAIQLNYGITPDQIAKLVDQTRIDALFLHLNPLQEACQPEGQTRFSGLLPKIQTLVDTLPIPVIAKEVGAGISPTDAQRLIEVGIKHIEIAGAGGTSWSRIEYERDQATDNPGQCFEDWGIPTPDALRLLHPYRNRLTLIASGGIRTGIDMAKACILGAAMCGIARPLLEPACQSIDAIIQRLQQLKREFTTAMFLLGTPTLEDLIDNHTLLRQ